LGGLREKASHAPSSRDQAVMMAWGTVLSSACSRPRLRSAIGPRKMRVALPPTLYVFYAQRAECRQFALGMAQTWTHSDLAAKS
jgi:hypothetical protein